MNHDLSQMFSKLQHIFLGQRVVAEAPCVALDVVAEEQVFEAIPVVPIALAPQRGWTRWCVRAALAVGNMIVNDGHVFF
jgi:hypothetical protein